MPESGLALTYFDFAADLGDFLGWGRGSKYGDEAWTARKEALIEQDVADGQRHFYWPMILPGERAVHSWSFMKPIATVTLTSGTREVRLPEDCLTVLSDIVVSADDGGVLLQPLKPHNPTRLRQLYSQQPEATGAPVIAAIQAEKLDNPTQSSRYTLQVFPEADQDYTLEFQYKISPEAINGARPYCYGGVMHVSTVQAAIRMASEQRRNDKLGIWTAKYIELLAKSVAHDRKNQNRWHGSNPDKWGRPMRIAEDHGRSAVLIAGIDPTT